MDTNNNINNDNHLENPDYISIVLPWDISIDQYNKFVDINQLPAHKYQQNTVAIPNSTKIDFSPLFQKKCFSFNRLHNNPLHKIEKLNRDTHLIETKGTDFLWVKDFASLPGSQTGDFLRQVGQWNIKNKLGIVFSQKSKYRLFPNINNLVYSPDVSFKTHAIYNLDKLRVKKNNITVHPPQYVLEVASYSQKNKLDIKQEKMVDWITAGVESGILYDGCGGKVYLYCRSNMLINQQHPNVQGQLNGINNEIVQLQQRIFNRQQRLLNTIGLLPDDILDLQTQLNQDQQELVPLQWPQFYYQNMNPVPGHPGVSFRTIPLWLNQNPQYHGPNMIIHCIGVTNGLKLNLSTIPMD
ncbi:hypothetical protein DLAC_00546 [Tieghemostelium lacteum]|uniref:Putative restriction endonuclease domain-containing protein n=1 Tax=Tieghemostelium lacteum TaxID=361077 RepID=A0A152AA94_TIELA|nr:hypothetical protein DLAC_00546 [Tieghemostelium lacteum]|eukprot:KYR03055.1 hypothetical protein DLAC_00546 [Tieghemostelium lacteum]